MKIDAKRWLQDQALVWALDYMRFHDGAVPSTEERKKFALAAVGDVIDAAIRLLAKLRSGWIHPELRPELEALVRAIGIDLEAAEAEEL